MLEQYWRIFPKYYPLLRAYYPLLRAYYPLLLVDHEFASFETPWLPRKLLGLQCHNGFRTDSSRRRQFRAGGLAWLIPKATRGLSLHQNGKGG